MPFCCGKESAKSRETKGMYTITICSLRSNNLTKQRITSFFFVQKYIYHVTITISFIMMQFCSFIYSRMTLI